MAADAARRARERSRCAAASPVSPAQADRGVACRHRAARRQGQDRMQCTARRSPSGRAPEALRNWLGEARSAARARPIEAQMMKAPAATAARSRSRVGHIVIRRKRAASSGRRRWRHRMERIDPRRAGLGRRARRRRALGRRRRDRRRAAGLVLFAPASWLARAIASSTGAGSSSPMPTARSGRAAPSGARGRPRQPRREHLPGRLEWKLAPRLYGVELAARQ